jgi:transcriptional regulator with XRE-family HTH domain
MARKAKNIDNVCSKVGKKIKQLRIDAGYSSAENFAYDNNLNRVQYWRVESGTANITLNTLLLILEIHEINLADFFSTLD